jgi:hypothetical protein
LELGLQWEALGSMGSTNVREERFGNVTRSGRLGSYERGRVGFWGKLALCCASAARTKQKKENHITPLQLLGELVKGLKLQS